MDFMTTVRILVRRWYVVILGLALTAAAANAVMGSIAPTYQTVGSVLIVAPSPLRVSGQQVDPLSLNPFTRFSAATTVLATVTVQIMDNVEVRERLAAEGAVRDYQVGIAPDQTPIVYVTVVNENEELAIRANALILASINRELDRRQAVAGAPEESRVRSLVITEPTRGTELVGGRVRAVLAVAVLGLAASLSTAFVVEGFAQSRARRTAGASRRRRGDRTHASSDGRASRRSRGRSRKQATDPADTPVVEVAIEPADDSEPNRPDEAADGPWVVWPAEEPVTEAAVEPPVPLPERGRGRGPVIESALEPRKRAGGRGSAVEPAMEAETDAVAVAPTVEPAVAPEAGPTAERRSRAAGGDPAVGGRRRARRRAPAVEPAADAEADVVNDAAVGRRSRRRS